MAVPGGARLAGLRYLLGLSFSRVTRRPMRRASKVNALSVITKSVSPHAMDILSLLSLAQRKNRGCGIRLHPPHES